MNYRDCLGMLNYRNRLGNYRNYLDILRIVIGIAIATFIFWNSTVDAALDCSKCHIAEPGRSSIIAKDTIDISNKTCMKCHNPEYPPSSIGYNTHLVHIGKYSAKVDYLTRHPKVADSLSCNSCHVNIGSNCRNCHVNNIPHISGEVGKNCKGCHGEVDQLFRHPAIDFKIHDIFNLGSDNKIACTMCHNPDDMRTLKLANDNTAPMEESHKLCYQCHNEYYRLWNTGSHYSNKTIPLDLSLDPSYNVGEPKKIWENNWKIKNTCVNCHNPHSPNELYQLPGLQATKDMTNVSKMIPRLEFAYIIGGVIFIIFILISWKNRDRIKMLISKISKISISNIPISISVEKYDSVEKKSIETNAVDTKIEEGLIKKEDKPQLVEDKPQLVEDKPQLVEDKPQLVEDKPSKTSTEKIEKQKKGFLRKHKGNILFVSIIGIMFLMFYMIFGTFMPIAVVVSESMSPHIEKGDIIFFTDINKIDDIKAYNNNSVYESLGNYGDVILYKPDGNSGTTPYVHRVMYYVEKGEPMWKDGPSAPHEGYITKGDNVVTNPKYDQQISISYQKPVKKEWIIGIVRFRIPYVGYIRLALPIN